MALGTGTKWRSSWAARLADPVAASLDGLGLCLGSSTVRCNLQPFLGVISFPCVEREAGDSSGYLGGGVPQKWGLPQMKIVISQNL